MNRMFSVMRLKTEEENLKPGTEKRGKTCILIASNLGRVIY